MALRKKPGMVGGAGEKEVQTDRVMTMECVNCGNPRIENRDRMLCASCNRLERKAANMKMPEDRKPINKVSDAQRKLLSKYAALRNRFLLGKWCAYHGKPCLPTTVHHSCGRVGYIDEYARERDIPALLDVRYFVPLCMEAHKYIEEHPKFAKEHGYSESRLSMK